MLAMKPTLAFGKPLAPQSRIPVMRTYLHTRLLLVALAALPLLLTACGGGGGY
jgi:hypothetical protein